MTEVIDKKLNAYLIDSAGSTSLANIIVWERRREIGIKPIGLSHGAVGLTENRKWGDDGSVVNPSIGAGLLLGALLFTLLIGMFSGAYPALGGRWAQYRRYHAP